MRAVVQFSADSIAGICAVFQDGGMRSRDQLMRELVWFDAGVDEESAVALEITDAAMAGVIPLGVLDDVLWFREQVRTGMLAECVMVQEEPFDFAECETHDMTFRLGEVCPGYTGTVV